MEKWVLGKKVYARLIEKGQRTGKDGLTTNEHELQDYAGNFGVVKECSLGRIGRQFSGGKFRTVSSLTFFNDMIIIFIWK